MKKIIAQSFFLNVMFIIGCSSGPDFSQKYYTIDPGARVFIMMSNGAEYTGELLSVRDSVTILCDYYNVRERDLADSNLTLFVLNNHDIRLIEIRGEGHPFLGIIFGSVLGGLIGAAIDKGSSENEEKEPKPGEFHFDLGLNFDGLTGCFLGGIFGGLIGGALGNNITDDQAIYMYEYSAGYDFTQLNIYSRYKGLEPEYIKKLK